MMVQDAKEDVNRLYRKMSKGYSDASGMEKVFEGLNDELNISELKKDIDRLKNKITSDHTNIV
jgi:peptidoglycan hydrolase CwlO-like protein